MTYTWTDNPMQGGAACDVDKVNDNLMHLKYDITADVKEYGLALSNGTDTEHEMDIAAGVRWDSTYADAITYAGGTIDIENSGAGGLDTGSVAASTQYYIWLCKGDSGVTAVFSASSSTPTLPNGYDSYKACIGRIITDGSSNIDNEKLWTIHPDGTETYIYEQTSGNFPNSNVSITHNLGTKDVDAKAFAVKDSDGTLYPLVTNKTQSIAHNISITGTNTCSLNYSNGNYYILYSTGSSNITNSSDYSLKLVIRSYL